MISTIQFTEPILLTDELADGMGEGIQMLTYILHLDFWRDVDEEFVAKQFYALYPHVEMLEHRITLLVNVKDYIVGTILFH